MLLIAMLYFAYGSNMSSSRLLARVPSARKLGTGMLRAHQLRFHKVGRDGSAKCDARETCNFNHVVHGVLFIIQAEDRSALDEVEGVGRGYEVKDVTVRMFEEQEVTAFTYYATHVDASLKPFDWYRQHVIYGAAEHNLPDAYQQYIQSTESIPDSDAKRRQRELSVYRKAAVAI